MAIIQEIPQDYDKNLWVPGMAITQDRMNTIETGIYVNREAIQDLDTATNANTTMIGDRPSSTYNNQTVWQAIDTKLNQAAVDNRITLQVSGITADSALGRDAMTQIATATTAASPTAYSSLDNRFAADEELIKKIKQALGQIYDSETSQYKDIYTNENTVFTALSNISALVNSINEQVFSAASIGKNPTTGQANSNMSQHMSQIDSQLTTISAALNTILAATGTDENNQPIALSTRIQELIDLKAEVDAAHRAVEEGEEPDTLVKRFTAIESQLNSIIGNINDNYVKKADVKNNFTSTDTNLPLSAAKGKELYDMIGGGGSYDSVNTVTSAINTAKNTAEDNAKAYAKDYADTNKVDKTSIYNELDQEDAGFVLDARQGKVLKDAIDTIDGTLNTENTGLVARITANEGAIATLNSDAATNGSVLNTVNTQIAVVVAEAPEAFDTLKEIADWIGNNSDDALTMQTNISNNASAISGLDARLTAIDNSTNGRMKAAEDDIDALETVIGDNNSGLTKRVHDLETEPKSATEIVVELPQTGDPNKDYLLGPNEDGKYFYYKWIVDGAENNWKLISGGGFGEGTSSAEILSTLPSIDEANENTDYYIGNNIDGYIHYRYIPSEETDVDGVFVSILPKNLINSLSVNTINVTTADAIGETAATVEQMSGGITAYNIAHDSNLLANFTALRHVRIKKTYDGETLTKQELIFTDTNGTELSPIEITGGGGVSTAYSMRLLGGNTFSIPASQRDVINITPRPIVNFGASLAEGIEITANVQYKLSSSSIWQNATIDIPTITNNEAFTLNVASLLGNTGTTTDIRVTIAIYPDGEDKEPQTANTTYHISRVDMSITALNYNPAAIRTGASFQFNYTCAGIDLQKTVYFKIDNVIAAEANIGTSHNETLAQVISLADITTGMHTLQVYFIANGISSNVISTYLICNKDENRTAPIVGLSLGGTEINQGDELVVNYTVYTPGDGIETTDKVFIEAYTLEDGAKTIVDSFELTDVRNATVETQPIANYPENENNEAYTLYVNIKAINNDDESLSDSKATSIVIKPFASNYTLTPAGVDNLIYSYSAYGKTNNSADKEHYDYIYAAHDANNTNVTFTTDFKNFNWSTDGYCGRSVTTTNDSGETVVTLVHDALTISGGAKVNINVPILSSKLANGVSIESDPDDYDDPTQNGRTIELDFTIRSATDLNDVIIDCLGSNGAGFQVTPQNCFLVKANPNLSEAVVKDETGAILNEDAIAAAYLSTGIRTHLVFVIEPWAAMPASDQKYHQSVNIYINGEFANACPYNRDNSTGNVVDSFLTDATITIGKPSCIIDLFSVKLYNRGLSHTQVLQNYKMAPSTRAERITRFEDNDVIKNNAVDYELARKKFNCLLLVGPNPVWATNNQGQRYNSMPTISPYKGSPSPIGRQKNGEVEGKTESGLIFTMPDATSEAGYKVEFELLDKLRDGGYASSNNVQGTSSQKYPTHNLKVYLAKGDGEPDENGLYAKSKKVKYKIPEVGVKGKESTLCWKADYMSTDHANTFNANVADSLFTDPMSPDWPSNWRDNVQFTVHGIRCLLFQKMGDLAPEFIADGCLNNDKGNSKSYGLEYPTPEDPAEIDPEAEYDVDGTADTVAQKWEFTNNSDDLGFFKYDSLFLPMGNDNHLRALDAFESCYPDQGDLEDAQADYKAEHDGVEDPNLNPNYNHLQILSTWIAQRANYWNETDPDIRASKKAIFKSEFTKHFILDHVLVYYLFSEYVALCDNRVKNMFMRSDTVRKEIIKLKDGSTLFEGNSNPNTDFFKEFTQIDTGVVNSETGEPVYAYNMKNADQIDWENSTFAIWAPVLYDLDSCFGVENVGLLKIPYNAGWQYQQDGSYLFNGHDSVFWLMFEDSFGSEIAEKALVLYNRKRGLNYSTFYQEQIVDNQNAIAPAMTNQDMLLKFDAPWATGFMNYANDPPTYETPEYKYLQRGSRATQKASFISKRSMLLSSKYQSNTFKNDRISMRYGADVAAADAVIKLSANQIFYPAVSFGDNKGWTQALELDDGTPVINGLVNAGETCRIRATSGAGGQDTLYIAGASVLTDVGDLSIFKAYEINISAAKNLKKIAFGSHAEGYTNARTTAIGGLSSCPLLEEINIENCTNFQSLDLSANGLIKKVYTQGSGVTSVSLPTGGVLNTLELSANTQNITLLNQTYLTNFIYENSANNNYANLRKLWIENTPNVPIVEIINSALGHLTEGVRITGLNVNLGTDTTFLETITSELALGKYITSSGVKGGTNSTPPTITGEVTVTSIRQSLYDAVTEMYPGLVLNVTSEIIPEYTITYYDYDGKTVLFTDHKTSSERYIDPVVTINPITNNYYIPMPTRDQDQQYIYYFGSYTSGATSYTVDTYRRFTGWNKVTTSGTAQLTNAYVDGNTTVIATYNTTEPRQYTIEWYAETTDKSPIYSLTAEYGTRVGDFLWPDDPGFVGDGTSSQMTRAKLVNNNYYRVFTGWDRPVGILTDNVKVYAQWQNSYISAATDSINFDDLTAADLYALSGVDAATRTKLLSSHQGLDTITIPLGNDFNYTYGTNATTIIDAETVFTGDETEAIICDGTNNKPTIKPFETLHDFTLAIDYKPILLSTLPTNTSEYVIASCYKSTGSTIQGFKVSIMNTGSSMRPVVVTWGSGTTSSTYAIIDYVEINSDVNTNAKQYSHGYRNIVVLSYSASNPNYLNVYYAAPGSSPSLYGNTITSSTLIWTTSAFDAPLIIGGNYDYSNSPIEVELTNSRSPSSGVVYWTKYWDTDLGGQNCLKLAAWPHEDLRFYLTGYDSGSSEASKLVLPNTNLSFVTASAIGDRLFDAQNISWNDDYASFATSSLSTFYASRIYPAFPASYQSIIKLTPINVNTNIQTTYGGVSSFTVEESSHYIFPPAEVEITTNVSSDKAREAKRQWPWLTTSTLANSGMVYELSGSSLVRATTATNIYPFLYRFNDYYIKPTTKIFNTGAGHSPYNNGQAWTVANVGTVKLASGDIWIQNDIPYIYVSAEDIERGVIIDIAETAGGWKLADAWQLRTYSEYQTGISNWRYFMEINGQGRIVDGGQTSTQVYGYYKGLVFEFAL